MTEASEITYRPWTWRPPEGGCIGKRRIRRKDGYEKTSGKAVYPRDVYRPGMLHAKPLTSPYAHARIKSMDTTNAMALPGVRDIIRYDEEGVNDAVSGMFGGTHETLIGEAHMWGDPVGAIVVADSEQICDQALRLIEIDWEELPFLLDWDEALEPGAPLLRPDLNPESNIRMQRTTEYGNLDEGFQEADHVIEFTVTSERDVWAGVEGHCNVAEWRDEYLNVWHGGQRPKRVQNSLSNESTAYNVTKNNIDVFSNYGGARFGGLTWTPFDNVVPHWAALAAKRVGRPVRATFDGSHYYGAEDRVGTYEFKIGFKEDGTITALDLNCIYNAQTLHDQISKIREHSAIENMRCVDTSPFNNYGYVVCYKHGAPATLVSSMVYNRVADALGMEPPEIALINEGASGHSIEHINEEIKAPLGFDPHSNSMEDVINECKQAIDWENNYHAPGTKILPNGKYHGIGCLFTIQWSFGVGQGEPDGVGIKFEWGGQLRILGRHNDGGWGAETAYCQIVADEAGFKYEDVTFRPFDGDYDLWGGGGSAGMTMTLLCMIDAGRKMKQLLCELATQTTSGGMFGGRPILLFPDKTPEELDIKDSVIFEKANPDNKHPVSMFPGTFYAKGLGEVPVLPTGMSRECMVRQAYFQEVEVDPETGQVEVKRTVAAQDLGQAINKDTCEGQTYGGVIMGVGRAYMERELFDPPSGVLLNDNLCGYPVATILDYGTDPEVHIIENHLGWAPYGATGVGESGAACGANLSGPAVHNAIGKWIDDYPITPDKILKALGKI